MRKTLLSLSLALVLTGCSEFPGVYKIDIPQGNKVTKEMIDQLKPGMNYNQVRYVMGTPLVTDTFNSNRWDYIYTVKEANGTLKQEQVSIFFVDERLSRVEGDYQLSK